jgi:hypothetical protein
MTAVYESSRQTMLRCLVIAKAEMASAFNTSFFLPRFHDYKYWILKYLTIGVSYESFIVKTGLMITGYHFNMM